MKRTLALVLAILTMLSLCACGGAAKETAAMDMAPAAAEPMEAYAEESVTAATQSYAIGTADAGSPTNAAAPAVDDKIIYSCYAEIETLDFDRSLADLAELIDRHGGFLESSSVRGSDYHGRGYRSADYVIRIPRESFETVTGSLSTIGNVSYSSIQAENISASYYDTESRLAAYRIEEERLLAMLEKAETVEDMLSIEDRLTEVRYNIESLTTTLLGWDSLINYSTIELSLQEVVEYTAEPELSYWQKLGRGFVKSLENVGELFMDLFRFIVVNLPVLVLLGAAAAVVLLLVRRKRRKAAAKTRVREEETKDE